MTLRKPYSEKQQEYIDSVDGNAHMSAVGIIGELEARDKEHLAKIESKSGFPREIDAKAQIFEGLENYGSNRSLAEEINHIMMGDVVEIKETIDQLWGIYNPDPVIINPKGNPNNATGK